MGFFLAEGLYTIIKVFYISAVDVSGKINAKRKGVEYKPAGDTLTLYAIISRARATSAREARAPLVRQHELH